MLGSLSSCILQAKIMAIKTTGITVYSIHIPTNRFMESVQECRFSLWEIKTYSTIILIWLSNHDYIDFKNSKNAMQRVGTWENSIELVHDIGTLF